MEMVLYMKNLDCPNCAEKIRAETERIPFVKKADMNFMAKKLSITAADESGEAVLREVRRITASMEPDVEVTLLENPASIPAANDDDSSDVKIMAVRIAVSAAVFIAGLIFRDSSRALWIFLAAYFIIGLDVLITAGKNILRGRPFDECFLMAVASLGAFFIGEYPEGVAVMILYQLGETLQDCAVRRSRKSVSSLMDIRPDIASVKRGDAVEQVPPETVGTGEIIVVKAG